MNKKMTIREIAGFCPEEAVWKMMADVSGSLLQETQGCVLTPDSIVIDGKMFLVESGHDVLNEFMAPEDNGESLPNVAQMVWTLGSLGYYTATGRIIFGGHGGCYQKEHPFVALPVLSKDLQALNSVLQKCLCYLPDSRISIGELNQLSLKGLAACEKQQRRKSAQPANETSIEVKHTGEKWPEEMIEI